MSKLILIKHTPPEVDPAVSSEQWHLGEKGRKLCEPLAERLKQFLIGAIVTSAEPKAVETGEELARRLGVATRTHTGLEEHDRRNVPHRRSGEFISMMELLFRRPGELVLGDETAQEALERFEVAVQNVLWAASGKTLAIVTHGTVMALFLARHNRERKGFDLW